MDSIRKLRQSKGMTQRELGEVIGVKQQTICKYERANSNVSWDILQKISAVFEVSLDELIEEDLEKCLKSRNKVLEKRIMEKIKKLNSKNLKLLLDFLSKLSDIV